MTDWLTEIYTALGGESGRYLGYSYGLSTTNALETLLQTPTLWGHDPTELNYVPAATNLIDDIKDLIGTAQETVDISILAPFPNGYFLNAIREGLQQAAKLHPHIIVRILDGIPIVHPGGSFEEFMEQLNPPSTVPVYIASMQSAMTSWNHAKLIIVDGKRAITGGHNQYSDVYCEIAPIHDVSMRLSGPAVTVAQNFLNVLWTYVASYSRRTSKPLTDQNARLWWNGQWYPNALPLIQRPQQGGAGTDRMLAVARLGLGMVYPSNDSNASKDARMLAAQLAQHSIKLSQQSFDNKPAGERVWSDDYLKVLAEAADQRGVEIWIVIAPEGAREGYESAGIQATAERIYDDFKEATGKSGDALKELLTQKVHLAPLHFYPDKTLPPGSNAWEWLMKDGSRSPPGNHAKIYIVDDELFYVGSDNAYPVYWNTLGLQEFGYLVAKTEADGTLWQPLRSYWDSLWQYSQWAQYDWSTVAEDSP